jgi:hypothetical protein
MFRAVTGDSVGHTNKAEVKMIQQQLVKLMILEKLPKWNGPRLKELRAYVNRRAMGIR